MWSGPDPDKCLRKMDVGWVSDGVSDGVRWVSGGVSDGVSDAYATLLLQTTAHDCVVGHVA